MVIKLAKKSPLKSVTISRVVVISGLLTFMYCIEFCIGIRTVYHTFKVWSEPQKESKRISWVLSAGSLFIAVVSVFTVNLLSAIWEQKQLEEKEKQKSSIRFIFHILIGGMLWRYITLWCIESKKYQKKGALLLAMIKFFFTQTFTIPMAIVHVSVMERFDELVFDVCTVLCVSVNLILTCTVFDWCSKEVEELKKWNYETVELIPLIFQSEPNAAVGEISKVGDNSVSKEVSKLEKQNSAENGREFEEMVIKFIVLLQSFAFSFGRLLALGILLKLAGMYAVSIMFLQVLISVIYLKFQAPILVSDSLPKWRQLSRLAFMSYILIFEWHINRDPKTAYDFSSNMKHSIFYYCIATVESVFYLVTWAITTSYASRSELGGIPNQQNKFCRVILIIGSLTLVFSLTIHIVLLFWHSRRISSFINNCRRRYETAKLRLSKYGCGKEKEKKPEKKSQLSHIDISSPIPIKKNDPEANEGGVELEKHNSYRDLREPLDDEIEIYFRKCDNKSKGSNPDPKRDGVRKITIPDESKELTRTSSVAKTIDHLLHREVNGLKSESPKRCEDEESNSTSTPVETSDVAVDLKDKKEEEPPPTAEVARKNKMASFSDSLSERWGKVSSASKKITGAMREQIQKRKEQFQSIRSSSESKTDKTEPAQEGPVASFTIGPPNEDEEGTEGYFVGDSRSCPDESLQSVHSLKEKRIRFLDEISSHGTFEEEADEVISPPADVVHREGDSPCPCYICRTLGDGRFRRRRSSSVPPADRKTIQEEDGISTDQPLSRYMSTPNISQSQCEKKRRDLNSTDSSSSVSFKRPFNFSTLSLENRIEHYV